MPYEIYVNTPLSLRKRGGEKGGRAKPLYSSLPPPPPLLSDRSSRPFFSSAIRLGFSRRKRLGLSSVGSLSLRAVTLLRLTHDMMDTSATTTTPPMPQCKKKPPTGGRVVLVVGCEGTGHHFLDAIYHGLHANHLRACVLLVDGWPAGRPACRRGCEVGNGN